MTTNPTKNLSTAIFLINNDVRAIAVSYQEVSTKVDTTKLKYQPAYLDSGHLPTDAVLFKTMNKDIKVNDLVVVPTNSRVGMTVCQVVGVDVEVDFDSSNEVPWIVDTVDASKYEEVRQAESSALAKIRAAQKNTRREELRKSLLANLGEGVDDIPMLSSPTIEPEKKG